MEMETKRHSLLRCMDIDLEQAVPLYHITCSVKPVPSHSVMLTDHADLSQAE